MREVVNTWEIRPPNATVLCARCGGHFINDAEGIKAHVVVHGHRPPTSEGLGN